MIAPDENAIKHIIVRGETNQGAPLLLFHKTGEDESELIPMAARVSPQRVMVALRGTENENGKLRFFRRLSAGVFDEASIIANAERIARFTESLCREQNLSKPIAVGLSNGANIIAAILMRHPDAFAGAVLFRPAPPFAIAPSHSINVPVLLTEGRDDQIVSSAQVAKLVGELADRGASVDHHLVQSGHGLCSDDEILMKDWLDRQP